MTNALNVETIIHWHGEIPSDAQGGVPIILLTILKRGEMQEFDYDPMPGTYWMHRHVPVQEMQFLAPPLIVRSAADLTATGKRWRCSCTISTLTPIWRMTAP